jgi:GMP synthase-like glutamine amidotransferase
MKPIAIFRLYKIEGPGYFATFLDSHSIPWKLIKIDDGENFPRSPEHFSGLVFMGGTMSANDNLPWISGALALIRQAVRYDIPVLGHCLGGQLMSKALGGQVSRSAVREIGWGKVVVADNPIASKWFGNLYNFESFHWHGEFFTLPNGATRLLSSKFCENQAFAIGAHLGMQCHLEMTEKMVKTWYEAGAGEIAVSSGPAVQSLEAVQKNLPNRISALNRVARHLYLKWISQVSDSG